MLATEVLSNAAVSRIVDDYSAVQTFEFPVIAAAAFRAKFAGVITSFGSKIAGRLRTVIPATEPGSAMLYEALRGEIDASFFDNAFEHLKGRGDTTGVAVPRLWYHRATWFDEPPDWPEDNMRAILAYVSGVDDSFPKFLRADTEDAGERATVDVEPLSSDDESPATQIGGVASGAAAEQRDQSNRALDPAIRLFNTYRRLIRAQVPARLDRVVAEIPEKCEGERCLRLKLAVVGEAFFDVIDEEELDALDPTDEEDAERIEALHEQLRGELQSVKWRGGVCPRRAAGSAVILSAPGDASYGFGAGFLFRGQYT